MNETQAVFTGLIYLLVLSILLQMAGFNPDPILLPGSPGQDEQSSTHTQSFGGQFLECLVTIFQDCDRDTRTVWFAAFTDAFVFAFSVVSFLFQMMTFQLPLIPAWMNALMILPAAVPLAWVGLNFIRGRPSS